MLNKHMDMLLVVAKYLTLPFSSDFSTMYLLIDPSEAKKK